MNILKDAVCAHLFFVRAHRRRPLSPSDRRSAEPPLSSASL